MIFKIVEEEKPAVEKLGEQEKEDLFISLLTGNDATSEVETSYGNFTVKFPKQKDRIAIGRLMSINRGGLPQTSFDVTTENRNLICSTLNVLVTKVPPVFEKVKKEKPNWSFEEVPDEKFLIELYQKVCTFRDEVQKRFDTEGKRESDNISAGEGVAGNVESGLFDGIQGGAAE